MDTDGTPTLGGERRARRLPSRPRGSPLRLLWAAPFTAAYVGVLVVTTSILAASSPRLQDRLLLARSTNLHHLARDPVRVLVTSAFWLSSPWQLPVWAGLFVLVLAPVEVLAGTLRTAATFAAGHVGATLVTAAGLWVALQLDAVERSVVHARDVGVSYGFFAVAAAATGLLPARLRLPGRVLVLAYPLAGTIAATTFTDVGHLVAVAIGLACVPLVRAGGRRPADGRPGSSARGS